MDPTTRRYPAFPIRVDPFEGGALKLVALLGWFVAAFSLAHFYYAFERDPDLLAFLLADGAFPDEKIGKKFFIEWGGYLLAGALYAGACVWIGAKRGMEFGQSLAAAAPGLAGCLFYLTFFFVGNYSFYRGAEMYFVSRVPVAMLLFWPVWRFKILRGNAPGEWGKGGRVAATALGAGLAALLIANPLGHALAKWAAWANNLTDLGLYVQMAWGWANGLPLHNTSYGLPADTFLAGEHALFSTILTAPLGVLPAQWIPLGLILFQAALLFGSAELVRRIARHYTMLPWAPNVLALIFLASPFVERSIIDDFHIDALEVPLLLALWLVGATWSGWRRWLFFLLLSALFLGCKEDAGLTYGALGAVFLLRRKTRWIGLFALLAGPAYTWGIVATVLSSERGSAHLNNYSSFGGSMGEIAKTMLTRPDIVFAEILEFDRRLSIGRVAFSVGMLVLFAPEIFLLAAGGVVTTILSDWALQHQLQTHYGLDVLAPATIAMIIGWGRLESLVAFLVSEPREQTLAQRAAAEAEGKYFPPEDWNQHRSEFEWRAMVLAAFALGLSLTAHVEFAKHMAFKPADWLAGYPLSERHAGFEEKIARHVAQDDAVATQNHLGSRFAARECVVWFPPPLNHRGQDGSWGLDERVNVVLLDAHGEMPTSSADLLARLREAVDEKGFVPERYWEGFLLLRKAPRSPDEERPPLSAEAEEWLADFARRAAPAP